ncbi:MAG: hypothetical protein QXS48_02040 [Candidatus Aenigmatarchaeota archaeon]
MKAGTSLKVFLTFVILLFIFFVLDLCLSYVIYCNNFDCELVPAIQFIPKIS